MIKNTISALIISASLGLLLSTTTTAGVYKWVDENGQVHYGEQPGNTDAQKITIRQNETTKPRVIKSEEDDETKDGEKKPDEAEAKKDKKTEAPSISKKEKRQLCGEAKSDIASISSRGRMREINKKGEYIYLGEKQRQQRLSTARKKQRKYCR